MTVGGRGCESLAVTPGSITLRMPDPEDLRDFPVKEDFGNWPTLERQSRGSQPNGVHSLGRALVKCGAVFCSLASTATLEARSRWSSLLPVFFGDSLSCCYQKLVFLSGEAFFI